MLMNLQSVSVTIKPAFIKYFQTELNIDDLQVHTDNIYLFKIPAEGEHTVLNEAQKQFIFQKEFSLYEEQYDIHVNYQSSLFDRLFEITWHGVVYHGEIKTL